MHTLDPRARRGERRQVTESTGGQSAPEAFTPFWRLEEREHPPPIQWGIEGGVITRVRVQTLGQDVTLLLIFVIDMRSLAHGHQKQKGVLA